MWEAIKGLFSGDNGILKGVGDILDNVITTKEEKALVQLKVQELLHKKEMEARDLTLKEQEQFNNRIKQLEGTASDLRQAGWLGRFILFFRGAQRPIWGFATMYIDFMVFSGRWEMPDDTQMSSAFWIMNGLVLGFLFGERALLNIAPKVKDIMAVKK
jgi:hypothetical protein